MTASSRQGLAALASSQRLSPKTKKSTRADTHRRLLIADLFVGLLLLVLAVEIGFKLVETQGRIDGTIRTAAGWPGWLQSQRRTTAWESVIGFAGITSRDFLLSGFFFAIGMQLMARELIRGQQQRSWWQSQTTILGQASLLLIAGFWLQSTEVDHIRWVLTHPLIQLGLVLILASWITPAPTWLLSVLIVILLIGHTCWYSLSEIPDYNSDQAATAFEQPKTPVGGNDRFEKWQQGQNIGDYTDRLWLSQIPQQPDARYRTAGRNTWNLIPALALLCMGMVAIRPLIYRQYRPWLHILSSLLIGSILIFSGFIGHCLYCPAIEKIMTASWVLIAGGYALALFGILIFLVHLLPLAQCFAPINRVGANGFVMYLLTVTCLENFCMQVIKLLESARELTHWPGLAAEYRGWACILLPMMVLLLAARIWQTRQAHENALP